MHFFHLHDEAFAFFTATCIEIEPDVKMQKWLILRL